jgi:hypothetical protein
VIASKTLSYGSPAMSAQAVAAVKNAAKIAKENPFLRFYRKPHTWAKEVPRETAGSADGSNRLG